MVKSSFLRYQYCTFTIYNKTKNILLDVNVNFGTHFLMK
jgi:hypothetical protein